MIGKGAPDKSRKITNIDNDMGEKEQDRYIVAFEIGSSKIRGAVGIVDRSGVVDVVATEEERLIDKVRYGCIENTEVSDALQRVTERLEAYPRVSPRMITGAYVALGGRSLMSRTVDVDLTLPTETEITRPIITELMQKASATVDPTRDVVEVVPVRFTVDDKTQANPVGTYGNRLAARMTVISCDPKIKRMLRRVVGERAGFNIIDYVNRTLAEADMVLTDDERRLGCMLVDFGAETTSVAIFKNGAAIYQATLPMGSRNITLDLTTLNYTEERAEEIKRVSGNAMTQDGARRKMQSADGIDYTEINNYVHARTDEIIANIMAQLEYAGVSDSDLPGGIIVVGGGARLRGFNDLLAQESNLKVRQGAPNASVRISDGSIHGTDAVDVISILLDASRDPYEECTEMPEEAETETGEDERSGYEKIYSGDKAPREEDTVRIGRLYDDDDDNNGKKKKHQSEKQPVKTGKSWLDRLQERLSMIMKEQEDLENEE